MLQKLNDLQGLKSFRLVKFFTFTSLVIMFTATITISALNAHWVRNILLEKSKEYDSLLVENLNHQIISRFMLPVLLRYKEIRLREENQFLLMDKVVRSTLHSFNVEMVTLYDNNNIISYSFDPDRIGQENAGGVHYDKAMKKETSSRLIQQGSFLELFFSFPQETKIITFAPLRAEKQTPSDLADRVLGVVEIVRDVSNDYKKVFKLQGLIVGSCFIIMGGLFIVLRFVVKHGEKIIERRAEERLKLEEKLRQAEHLSAIGEMTAGVSHEIRNPLGIIKSSAQLLKKQMEKLGTTSSIPDIIVEESARLDNIITDFLDFAKPKIPDLHPCRIEEIIEKNIVYLSPRIEDYNLNIIKEISKNLPEIMADSAMLHQAFLNIFINAFQSLKRNGCLTIRIKYDSGNIVINFLDNGDGIPEEILKKIWTPFFTTKDTGTGLGLGIVKNMIEAHKGIISITNTNPKGANVEIRLPV
ncbi:MAG: two-component sensor histidine kinase [Desulfobacula sp.]|jgi:signal transduction histidine kinase|uniref:two-component system sensor histidine kinase NtrB n=1 Tax=Desulfobacula sp. TaxID=2593537 RepID=UPI001DD39541|nr:two-component sensor histidine kinase [Desulfobacula sp.]MBT3485095.1 two-component sensor histidine kinase [Desulfobacula sp.]MBT3804601.1 two-component sensor histidine kinase [Desulfobacula sp.]MBT4025106.1 two-component sensor histidine kinase [Desulfobacula sp.]MBT4198259.1 two-component sensor histidine kinase [Desulfobacula sp.]